MTVHKERIVIIFSPPEDGRHLNWDIVEEVLRGYTILLQIPPIRAFVIATPEGAHGEDLIQQFLLNPHIKDAEFSVSEELTAFPNVPWSNDPAFYYWQEGINLPMAHVYEMGHPDVVIGIIDGPILLTHEEIAPRHAANPIQGYSPVPQTQEWYYGPGQWGDSHGHHVYGNIFALKNNGVGFSGIAPGCTPFIYFGNGINEYEAACLVHATAYGVPITNNSYFASQSIVFDAVNEFLAAGGVFVHSAGNSNYGTVMNPNIAECVHVGALMSRSGGKSLFSNYGDMCWITTIGTDVWSLGGDNNSDYAVMSGTSMASPTICGICGLILSVNRNLTNDQIKQCLYESTDYPVISSYSSYFWDSYGNGNAYKAVIRAMATLPEHASHALPTFQLVHPVNGITSITIENGVAVYDLSYDLIVEVQVFGSFDETGFIQVFEDDVKIYEGPPLTLAVNTEMSSMIGDDPDNPVFVETIPDAITSSSPYTIDTTIIGEGTGSSLKFGISGNSTIFFQIAIDLTDQKYITFEHFFDRGNYDPMTWRVKIDGVIVYELEEPDAATPSGAIWHNTTAPCSGYSGVHIVRFEMYSFYTNTSIYMNRVYTADLSPVTSGLERNFSQATSLKIVASTDSAHTVLDLNTFDYSFYDYPADDGSLRFIKRGGTTSVIKARNGSNVRLFQRGHNIA